MKKLLLVILLALGAYLFWWWWNHRTVESYGQELFYDRVWVDHLPRSQTESFKIMAAVTQQPVGLFQTLTMWKGDFERFRYEPRGDGKLQIVYPQTRERDTVSYRAVACEQRDFDYCLELAGNTRGTQRYFSRKGWEVRAHSLDAVEAEVQALAPAAP